MNQELINTCISFPSQCFDVYRESMNPADSSCDIFSHPFLPQAFIDFVGEFDIKNLDRDLQKPSIDNNDPKSFLNFHDQVIQLLMAFSLNFCKNGNFDFNLLKLHSQIIQEDLYLDQLLPAFKTLNFYDNFPEIKQSLQSLRKSAIFIFNTEESIDIKLIKGSFIENSPIIIVYSDQFGMVLHPSSFFYYTKINNVPRAIQSPGNIDINVENKHHYLLQLYEYNLINDHWVSSINNANINQMIEYLRTNQIADFQFSPDHLEVNFRQINRSSKYTLIGIMGNTYTILSQLFKLKETIFRKLPFSLKPAIYFCPAETDNALGYMFLYMPKCGRFSPYFLSPSHPAYIEAVSDALMKLRTHCSKVIFLPSSNIKLSKSPQPVIFDSYLYHKNDVKLIMGSYNTANIVSYYETQQDDQILSFKSIEHLRQWFNWAERSYNIQNSIDAFKSNSVKLKKNDFSFQTTEFPHIRFFARNRKTKISCRFSEEIYNILSAHYFKLNVDERKKNLNIREVIAFEDGHIDLKIDSLEEKRKTYAFLRFRPSNTKPLILQYTEEIATLRNINSSFILMNSYSLDDGVLLVLFYSQSEKKVLLTILRNKFDDQIIPEPFYEIQSVYKYHSESAVSMHFQTAFNLATRTLLFVIERESEKYLVKMVIPLNYVKITDGDVILTRLTQFYPIEVADTSEVQCHGFVFNEDGTHAILVIHAPIDITIKKELKSEKGTYYFLVYFNPYNLERLKTIRLNQRDPNHVLLSPFLYMNKTIGFWKLVKEQQDFTYQMFLKPNAPSPDNDFCQNGDSDNDFLQSVQFSYDYKIDGKLEFIGNIFNVINCNNSPAIIYRTHNQNQPTGIEFQYGVSQIAINAKQREYISFASYFVNQKQSQHSNSNDDTNFDYSCIQQLIQYTYSTYGVSIIQQMSLPRPDCYPLHLSLFDFNSFNSLEEKMNITNDNLIVSILINLVKSLQSFASISCLEFKEINSIQDSEFNVLHTSPAIFLYSIFTHVEVVVSEPIVDSATSAILNSNFNQSKTSQSFFNQKNDIKTISHLCYTLRVNRFPNFPFLRMTTKCPSYHIGVISENGSSLLNWLTGISFSQLPNNTLAIGSNPIPHISKSTKCVNDKMKLLDKAVDGLTNVVGSLFTVEESSFSQVVAFITALTACDLIILDFTQINKIREFFDKFLKCAETIANQFHLKFPTDQNSLGKKIFTRVVFFCEDTIHYSVITNLQKEIVSMVIQRGSPNSFVAHILQKCELVIESRQSSEAKATILKQMNFVNCSNAWRSTIDLMGLLCQMTAVFGQQVDYEANGGFFGFTKESSTINSNDMLPFVREDADEGQSISLISLAKQILDLKNNCDEFQQFAENLYRQAAYLGNQEALEYLNEKGDKEAKELLEKLGYTSGS